MNRLTIASAVLLTVPVLAGPALSGPAQASHGGDDDVRRSGSCSGHSTWKVEAGPDDGRIEVEVEIDSDHAGQTWRWKLRHDGRVADTGRSVTRGASGSFEVERRTGDGPGRDTFTFRARHHGERCVARVRV